jgi:hypothetical protein
VPVQAPAPAAAPDDQPAPRHLLTQIEFPARTRYWVNPKSLENAKISAAAAARAETLGQVLGSRAWPHGPARIEWSGARRSQVVRTADASGSLICTRARGKIGEHRRRCVSCDLRLLESVVLGGHLESLHEGRRVDGYRRSGRRSPPRGEGCATGVRAQELPQRRLDAPRPMRWPDEGGQAAAWRRRVGTSRRAAGTRPRSPPPGGVPPRW